MSTAPLRSIADAPEKALSSICIRGNTLLFRAKRLVPIETRGKLPTTLNSDLFFSSLPKSLPLKRGSKQCYRGVAMFHSKHHNPSSLPCCCCLPLCELKLRIGRLQGFAHALMIKHNRSTSL